MSSFKGYVYVVISGIALLAAAVFLALQWDIAKLTAGFSVYGSPREGVPTIYVMLGSAVGGLLVYWMCRMMVRGVRILWKVRGEQGRAAEAPSQRVRAGSERQNP